MAELTDLIIPTLIMLCAAGSVICMIEFKIRADKHISESSERMRSLASSILAQHQSVSQGMLVAMHNMANDLRFQVDEVSEAEMLREFLYEEPMFVLVDGGPFGPLSGQTVTLPDPGYIGLWPDPKDRMSFT